MTTDTEAKVQDWLDWLGKRLATETDKAFNDAVLYGSGFLRIDYSGNIEYISAERIHIDGFQPKPKTK